MSDSISRKGVSAWLYNMGHEKLSEYVLDKKRFPSEDRPKGMIHIDEVYRLIAGHSNYHGDSILSAFTCLVEGKDVKPIAPLDECEKHDSGYIWNYERKEKDDKENCSDCSCTDDDM